MAGLCKDGKEPPGSLKANTIESISYVGCDPGDRIDFAQDSDQWQAYVRAVMNLRVT